MTAPQIGTRTPLLDGSAPDASARAVLTYANAGVRTPAESTHRPGASLPQLAGPRIGQLLATRVGLVIPSGLRFEDWAAAGPKIVKAVNSFSWCLGDWLVYGRHRFDDRYALVIAAIGLDYKTLRNYAWVARKVPMERRRETLSFQHHAEVAGLSAGEQDQWLSRAEELSWNRSRLRRELAASRTHSDRDGGQSAEDSSVLCQLSVTTSRIRAWRNAAERQSIDLESWIMATLDGAAARWLAALDADAA